MDDASLRASDADREQTLAALREHMVAGRLTLEEFCARADAALRAGVAGELAHLQDDLPNALMTSPDSRRRPARFTAALLGHVVRRGRFRLRRCTPKSPVTSRSLCDWRRRNGRTIDHASVAPSGPASSRHCYPAKQGSRPDPPRSLHKTTRSLSMRPCRDYH
jgi:hypothetical protein